MNNTKTHDSAAKLLFGNSELCAQFLRSYSDLHFFKNVRAEDITDVTTRFTPMFTEEREADVVKQVHIDFNDLKNTMDLNSDVLDDEMIKGLQDIFVVALIEHKSKVEYNIPMQILRYQTFIWDSYEKQSWRRYNENRRQNLSPSQKGFKYPPIIPIVFYEDINISWTADMNLKDRVLFGDFFADYIPDFKYHLVRLSDYDFDSLTANNDAFAAAMMIIQSPYRYDAFKFSESQRKWLSDTFANSSEEIRRNMVLITETLMRKSEFEESEIIDVIKNMEDVKMGALFESSGLINVRALRSEADTLRSETKALRSEAKTLRSEAKTLRSEAETLRLDNQHLRNETIEKDIELEEERQARKKAEERIKMLESLLEERTL